MFYLSPTFKFGLYILRALHLISTFQGLGSISSLIWAFRALDLSHYTNTFLTMQNECAVKLYNILINGLTSFFILSYYTTSIDHGVYRQSRMTQFIDILYKTLITYFRYTGIVHYAKTCNMPLGPMIIEDHDDRRYIINK